MKTAAHSKHIGKRESAVYSFATGSRRLSFCLHAGSFHGWKETFKGPFQSVVFPASLGSSLAHGFDFGGGVSTRDRGASPLTCVKGGETERIRSFFQNEIIVQTQVIDKTEAT